MKRGGEMSDMYECQKVPVQDPGTVAGTWAGTAGTFWHRSLTWAGTFWHLLAPILSGCWHRRGLSLGSPGAGTRAGKRIKGKIKNRGRKSIKCLIMGT